MKNRLRSAQPVLLLIALMSGPHANALTLSYDGELVFCLVTCDSFAAWGAAAGGSSNTTNSTVLATFDLPTDENGEFSVGPVLPPGPVGSNCALEIGSGQPEFSFRFSNSAAPMCVGCGVTEENPLELNQLNSVIVGAGQVSNDGRLVSGSIQVVPTFAPLCNNNAVWELDAETGELQGIILNAVTFMRGIGAFDIEGSDNDLDGDGSDNSSDNCTFAFNAAQRDSDEDGYGNVCDPDLNNDCIVNFLDLGLFRQSVFTDNPDTDLNGDGMTNMMDLGRLRALFFGPPGPSNVSAACSIGTD
ncbi:MAG: hypothetical protein AAF610_09285 [Pseudomonadota bacterium]